LCAIYASMSARATHPADASGWHSALSRWVLKPRFWLPALALLAIAPLAPALLRPQREPLPVLSQLEDFSLIDQRGEAFGSNELRGKVWMAGFIFTNCPTICPTLTATMGRVQKRARQLAPHFRLVSFSVDPRNDTPVALAAYARQHKASSHMWSFLTGSLQDIQNTVEESMKIAMGEMQGETDFASLVHGTHFVLVDSQLRIRRYYDSTAPDVVDEIVADAAMLINRGD